MSAEIQRPGKVQQLEKVVQQNATSAEQLASMAEELSSQAEGLSERAAYFQLSERLLLGKGEAK